MLQAQEQYGLSNMAHSNICSYSAAALSQLESRCSHTLSESPVYDQEQALPVVPAIPKNVRMFAVCLACSGCCSVSSSRPPSPALTSCCWQASHSKSHICALTCTDSLEGHL